MVNPKITCQSATNSVAQNRQKVNFDALKRAYETAYNSGDDYTEAVYNLATAIAHSVINKCLDPQRKTAPNRDTVSNNGASPALRALKSGIVHDTHMLDNIRRCADEATRLSFDSDGDLTSTIDDNSSMDGLSTLIRERLSDGLDLVQDAITALLEQSQDHARQETGWLDTPYIVHRLRRKVYIRLDDSAAYIDDETTPIQEVYRAVRRAVQANRAIATDPSNGYSYIEGLTADGLDTIYYRLHRHADLGGYNSDSQYTVDRQSVVDYETIIERLALTDRQATIVSLRMQGKGMRQIATYLGVRPETINKTLARLRERCADLGFAPQDLDR